MEGEDGRPACVPRAVHRHMEQTVEGLNAVLLHTHPHTHRHTHTHKHTHTYTNIATVEKVANCTLVMVM